MRILKNRLKEHQRLSLPSLVAENDFGKKQLMVFGLVWFLLLFPALSLECSIWDLDHFVALTVENLFAASMLVRGGFVSFYPNENGETPFFGEWSFRRLSVNFLIICQSWRHSSSNKGRRKHSRLLAIRGREKHVSWHWVQKITGCVILSSQVAQSLSYGHVVLYWYVQGILKAAKDEGLRRDLRWKKHQVVQKDLCGLKGLSNDTVLVDNALNNEKTVVVHAGSLFRGLRRKVLVRKCCGASNK